MLRHLATAPVRLVAAVAHELPHVGPELRARLEDAAARELNLVTRSELRVACGHVKAATAAVATIDREERERLIERIEALEAGRFVGIPTVPSPPRVGSEN
jgi:hypothetical protein